jgi:hypothetical protein
MKKNLKKVFSAVIALAVSASMIPASFAAKLVLTDVADTASYATAVNTLVALNIINGYEDDSFKPDNLITRAETTKVVVAALNKTDVAEGMKGNTGFTDIEARHEWATGFINAGVAEGFINGMENNTFGPDLNVTYAQIVTMLVRALGYEEYAQYMGGYPNGYLSIANSEGVTKGVSANANEAVTRAQVAVLVYNALQTPIVANTGMVYSATAGGFVPNIEKQDGTNDTYYKTLLTEDFDAYFVEGYVTETSKDGTLKSDEVKFAIAKSEKYDEDEMRTSTDKDKNPVYKTMQEAIDSKQILTAKVGDTDAADYKGSYAQAIVMIDDYGDNILVSFIPSGKNKSVKIAATLIDTDDYSEVGGVYKFPAGRTYLEYFASESSSKSTKYNLQKDSSDALAVDVYVNGVKVDGDAATAIETYVINCNVGDVELVDTYKTDGYYDTIYVNDYVTAEVSAINTNTGRVSFSTVKSTSGVKGSYIELDEENDDLTFHIYYNGEEVGLSSLKADDIVSIAMDPNVKNLYQSNFYDVYVSRDTASAKLSGKNDTDKEVNFSGTTYEFVDKYDDVKGDLNLGDEYTLSLDYFGRIFDYELNESADKYAVIDKYTYYSADDDYRAYLYTAEGTNKTYLVDSTKATVYYDGTQVATKSKNAVQKAIKDKVYVDGEKGAKTAVQTRVVKYKVSSSSGYITSIDFLTSTASSDRTSNTFNERTQSIGSVKMDASTKIVDAIDYVTGDYDKIADLSIATVASFTDDKGYTTFAYGKKTSNNTYPFVLVTEGAKTYNENTRFAVISASPNQITDESGDEVYQIKAFYKGEEQEIIVADDATGYDIEKQGLNAGDIVVFNLDAKGYISDLHKISTWADITDFATIRSEAAKGEQFSSIAGLGTDHDYWQAIAKGAKLDDITAALKGQRKDENGNPIVSDSAVTLVFGPIVSSSSKNLTLGLEKDGKTTDIVDTFDISLSSDTNIYEYDYSQPSKSRLNKVGAIPSFKPIKDDKTSDVITWTSAENEQAKYAFVLAADSEALDVLVLSAK